MPGLLHDRRDRGVGYEALPALLVPVEDRPDPIGLGGIAVDEGALAAVLPSSYAMHRETRDGTDVIACAGWLGAGRVGARAVAPPRSRGAARESR